MSEPDANALEALFADYDRDDAPGASVMIIRDGEVLFARAYGMADLERKIPCTLETNFRLASVTKQFTAMAILILSREGRLSLDDSLTQHFHEFPEYGEAITLRQVLTHRSGLIDYEDVIPAGTTIPLSDRDVLHLLRQQNRTYFPPGSEFRYSNSGYALLALLVEIVSGETFPAFLKRHIFEPLEMNSTMAYVAGMSLVPRRAYGYASGREGWQFRDQSLTSAVLGDGGIYSSVADLLKWDQALREGKLIGRDLLNEAFTAHSLESDFPPSGYGYGWYVGRHRGADWIWHYGSTSGFSTRLERFPEQNLTVIILTNRRGAALSETGRKLADMFWQ